MKKKKFDTGSGLTTAVSERMKAKKDGQLFTSAVKKLVNFSWEQLKKFVKTKQILKLISGKEDIFLTTNGVEEFESIWDSRIEFRFIDEDFANHAKTHTRGPRPKSVQVKVYELAAHAWTSAMFSSLNEDLYLLSLTQHEILSFIRHHKEYLDVSTFFLFKSGHDSDANFHIAQVMVYNEDGGSIGIDLVGVAFECGFGPSERRIVVRQPLVDDIDVELRS